VYQILLGRPVGSWQLGRETGFEDDVYLFKVLFEKTVIVMDCVVLNGK
jgi:hypothetical protein